ncbi:MAG TPA: hypothetical protein VEV81_08200, partial [Pyrinomonadaceae bacterium]|nr:hypothetical protein [Pyrinomonadaceae bacterium]
MKLSLSRIARVFILASLFTVTHSAVLCARGQTSPPVAPPTNPEKGPSLPAIPQAKTEREKRAQAYARVLEGQRYISEWRRSGSAETLQLARQAFQEATTLDPTLAEAHTALAELAFYYPPQDFETAAREGTAAARVDPNNLGAHRVLSRLYAVRSGLREGSLNRQIADLAIK